ncbi:MAG: hypothetical protein AB7Q17_08135 [Phycisphaerae bacterium]
MPTIRLRKLATAALLGGLALGLAGCSTLVKQAVSELRGPQAKLLLDPAPTSAAFAAVNAVRFSNATSSLGPRLCPASVAPAYDAAAREAEQALASRFPGGPPELRIDAELIFFQDKGILSAAELIARIRMRDDGRTLADGIVKVESSSFRAGDETALAREAVREIRKYLESQRPTRDEKSQPAED